MNYEIHLTVNKPDSLNRFKEVCKSFNVKPLVIATGDYDQVMTSSIYKTDYIDNFHFHLHDLSMKFESEGYNVLRKKVEIMPSIVQHKDHIYYESHVRIKIPNVSQDRIDYHHELIDVICLSRDLQKSKNLFKVDKNFLYQMVTFRTHEMDIWDFGKHMKKVRQDIENNGFLNFDKIELEECIYDSNIDIDKKWLNKFNDMTAKEFLAINGLQQYIKS